MPNSCITWPFNIFVALQHIGMIVSKVTCSVTLATDYAKCHTPHIMCNAHIVVFVVCPALHYPQHGQLEYSNQQQTVGTTVTYSCNSVFVTNGSKVRECQIDATWSGSAPTCISEYSTCGDCEL